MSKLIPLSQRLWDNWTSVSELASQWSLTKRRVQQILKSIEEDPDFLLLFGTLVGVDDAKPVYKVVPKRET